jgi:hypothetical protein
VLGGGLVSTVMTTLIIEVRAWSYLGVAAMTSDDKPSYRRFLWAVGDQQQVAVRRGGGGAASTAGGARVAACPRGVRSGGCGRREVAGGVER